MKKPTYMLPACLLLIGVIAGGLGFEHSPLVVMLEAVGLLGIIWVWSKRRDG